jgi:peptidoglycan/xylan/chitin deacetylase (PgdA/CDA1 family)
MRIRLRRRTWVLLTGLVLVVVLLWNAGVLVLRPPRWIHRAAQIPLPAVLTHVETDSLAVALTIDDAPSPEVTPGLLEVLRRHGARATFFVIGSYAEEHPDLLAAIRADGHELANHLYLDEPSIRLDDEEFLDKLRRTDAIIEPDGPVKWFRPGSGWIDDRMVELLQQEGYRACLASVYPLDLVAPRWLTEWQFTANVQPGAILVLHDGGAARARNVAILDAVLGQLAERGVRVVAVSELVAMGRAGDAEVRPDR